LYSADFIEELGPLTSKLGYALKTGLKLGLFYSGEYDIWTIMVIAWFLFRTSLKGSTNRDKAYNWPKEVPGTVGLDWPC
jgi:hypothetical protein